MLKILITGGGGFLGEAIVRELLKNPHYMVTNFSRSRYSTLEDMGVPTITGDLRSVEDCEHALMKGFDIVIHTAAVAGMWGSDKDFYDINYLGTKNILDAAIKYNVKKFVYTSSPSVIFGLGDHSNADESLPYPKKHLNQYAETKAMAEKLVLQTSSDQILTAVLRPHLIFGEKDPHIIPRLLQKGRRGKLKIVGNGENLVDVIYVENAARAHVQLMEKLTSSIHGNAYFIGQERPVKLWDFINEILKRADVEPVSDMIDAKKAYYIGYVMEKMFKALGIMKPEPPMTRFVALNLSTNHYYSHKKAEQDFGYVPSISIDQALDLTFKNRQTYKKYVAEIEVNKSTTSS